MREPEVKLPADLAGFEEDLRRFRPLRPAVRLPERADVDRSSGDRSRRVERALWIAITACSWLITVGVILSAGSESDTTSPSPLEEVVSANAASPNKASRSAGPAGGAPPEGSASHEPQTAAVAAAQDPAAADADLPSRPHTPGSAQLGIRANYLTAGSLRLTDLQFALESGNGSGVGEEVPQARGERPALSPAIELERVRAGEFIFNRRNFENLSRLFQKG
jgi:hypothetical protein